MDADRVGELAPLRRGDALLIVDLQNDFLPGGALAVPGGDAVIAPINACLGAFAARGLPVLASRDWHPSEHASFREQGGPWPAHCIAGTPGADFAPALRLPADTVVVSKAATPRRDAYSAFDGTDLADRLHAAQITRLFVVGLATDYCVLASVRDALSQGFAVIVLADAIAAVDVQQGDGERALAAMRAAGATIARSTSIA